LPRSKEYYIACSGGVDSVSVLHWLSKSNRLPLALLYVHHNTGDYASKAENHVRKLGIDYKTPVIVHYVDGYPPKSESKEAWWRKERYSFFQTFTDFPIILAHHLDDCVEQYIMSSLVRLKSYKLISYNGPSNTIRPFRTWTKKEIYTYARKHKLEWIEDPSNTNNSYCRNKIRNILLPEVLKLNPGIYKLVKNMILNEETS
jgi:tRNA(Ile)-lysidine synthase